MVVRETPLPPLSEGQPSWEIGPQRDTEHINKPRALVSETERRGKVPRWTSEWRTQDVYHHALNSKPLSSHEICTCRDPPPWCPFVRGPHFQWEKLSLTFHVSRT